MLWGQEIGRKQTAMASNPISWDNPYPEYTRGMATYRKQIGTPPQTIRPRGTNTQQRHDGLIPRYDLYQESKSEIPVRSRPQCHRGTPAPLLDITFSSTVRIRAQTPDRVYTTVIS